MKQDTTISLLLFCLFIISPIHCNRHQKCCKPGQRLVEKNSKKHVCENNPNKRLQTNFKNNDFLIRNITGTCVEVHSQDEIAIYSYDQSTLEISKTQKVEVQFFTKCCHLGHQYNQTLHSCVRKENSDDLKNLLFDDSFIKIGLPKCEIISDQILNSVQDIKRDDNQIVLSETGKIIPGGKYCLDSTVDDKLVVRICEESIQVCSKVRCIHKCCADGQSFVNGSNCKDTFRYGVDLHSTSKIHDPDAPFAIIHGIHKPIYYLNERKYNFFVDRFGLFASYMNKTQQYEYYTVSNESYCMEYAYKKGMLDGYSMFSRQITQKLETKIAVTRWVKLISCFFLLLTIIVYLLLPKIRNLFGKILLSYSVATFLFFAFLSFPQFYLNLNDHMCKVIGYCSLLSSIWSFTWLHIMCIDIWFSFGSPRTVVGPLQKNELKRLLQYSAYGWGFGIVWILMIILFNSTTMLPEAIHPYIGTNKCYMENTDIRPGNYAYFLYITLPLLIQQIINSVLFIKTIMYCLKIKAEIERMNDANKQTDLNASKERLGLIMKLAVIMGVSFLFETVSSIYNFQNTKITTVIEVIWDTINCLQGVFIFIIFICKKKVYDSICERIPILKPRKTSVSSTATTHVSMQNIGANKRDTSTSKFD